MIKKNTSHTVESDQSGGEPRKTGTKVIICCTVSQADELNEIFAKKTKQNTIMITSSDLELDSQAKNYT